jgi:hypothetical protein
MRWSKRCLQQKRLWVEEIAELRGRMTQAGAFIRSEEALQSANTQAWEQARRIQAQGCGASGPEELKGAFRARQLSFAQAVYLSAIQYAVQSGVGSRGSAIVLNPDGQPVHPLLGSEWKITPEDASFRSKVLETQASPEGSVQHEWVERRPIPEPDSWFETTWSRFRNGEIYATE